MWHLLSVMILHGVRISRTAAYSGRIFIIPIGKKSRLIFPVFADAHLQLFIWMICECSMMKAALLMKNGNLTNSPIINVKIRSYPNGYGLIICTCDTTKKG